MVTERLLDIFSRLEEREPDQLLRDVHPATYRMSRAADIESLLTLMWGGATIPAGLIMAGMASTLGRIGLGIGTSLTFGCVVGMAIHGARFVIARLSARIDEWAFRRKHGADAWYVEATGGQVEERRHPLTSWLVRSGDYDLLIQMVLGVTIAFGLGSIKA